VTKLLANFLIPHRGNGYYPHSIRPYFLSIYLVAILAIQLTYNLSQTGEAKVLSFATNIQQTQIISLTNQQRQQNGQGVLKESSLLDQVAAKKAADMFAGDYWAHVSPTGVTPWHWFDVVGYHYIYAGENLARDFDTTSGVIDGWMNSPGHRENLLSGNYSEIGVAVVNGTLLNHETTLVVQEFGKPQSSTLAAVSPPPTPTSVPTPAPQPVAQGSGVSQSLQPPAPKPVLNQPVTANPYIASPQAEVDTTVSPAVLSLEKLNGGQRLMLALLIPIIAFFIFDAVVVWRRRHTIIRGHSLAHASALGLVVLLTVTSSFGVLR
jgi:uncharacterized protein YkwD